MPKFRVLVELSITRTFTREFEVESARKDDAEDDAKDQATIAFRDHGEEDWEEVNIPEPQFEIVETETYTEKCDGCGKQFIGTDELDSIEKFSERVGPGMTGNPTGQCPDCGALVFNIERLGTAGEVA